MSAEVLLQQAAGDGVTVDLTPAGTLKVRGPDQAVSQWVPKIRAHRPEIVTKLRQVTEARRRLDRVAEQLGADLADLLDWYQDDMQDIVSFDEPALRDIVADYAALRRHYRQLRRATSSSDPAETAREAETRDLNGLPDSCSTGG